MRTLPDVGYSRNVFYPPSYLGFRRTNRTLAKRDWQSKALRAIYVITDDLLRAVGHTEDCRRVMSDTEVITSALVAAKFFGGNQEQACNFLLEDGLIPKMLSKSRFSRRWHRLFLPLLDLFDYLGQILKSLNSSSEYLLDSFPVPICDNIRIPSAKLVNSEDYRG